VANYLSGKEVNQHLVDSLTHRIALLEENKITPLLALVRVGQRPDDLSYERAAIKRAENLGIEIQRQVFNENISQRELEEAILAINEDERIHGCLLFRPLPSHIDEQAICDSLSIEKDIDGISTAALASIFIDSDKGFAPCTAAACLEMIDYYQIPLTGKHVVVIGRSLVIGKPVAMMLLRRNASVTICHSKTEDLPALCQTADIVICATGRPQAYGVEYFRPGQVVLDVGINYDEAGNLYGDVDFEAVEPIVEAITPVPGGIGTITTSMLMKAVISAAEQGNFS